MDGQEIHDDDLHQRDVHVSHRPGVGFVSQNRHPPRPGSPLPSEARAIRGEGAGGEGELHPAIGFVSQNPIVSRLPALASFRKIARQIATGGEDPKMSGNLWKSLEISGLSGSCLLEPTGWSSITGRSLPSAAIYLFACVTSVINPLQGS